jgi:hypothetical protein
VAGRRDRNVTEAVSFGFDEFLQTFGSDPTLSPTSVGLRVPALPGVWYVFLGARADLTDGDAVVGYRQLVTIAEPRGTNLEIPTQAPLVPFERHVEAPQWHPPDGFVSWHLTTQPMPQAGKRRAGPFDQESFAFEDSTTPALLYETAHFPALPPAPGYLGLDGYSAPMMRGTSVLTLRDVRAPWHEPAPFRLTIDRPTAVRFYIAVFQTNPATRTTITLAPSGFADEGLEAADNFAQLMPLYQYWRVGVGLLIERARRRRKPCP